MDRPFSKPLIFGLIAAVFVFFRTVAWSAEPHAARKHAHAATRSRAPASAVAPVPQQSGRYRLAPRMEPIGKQVLPRRAPARRDYDPSALPVHGAAEAAPPGPEVDHAGREQ